MPNVKNLIPIKTLSNEEAKKRGSKGREGVGSGPPGKETHVPDIWRVLAERFKVRVDGKDQEITGADLVGRVVKTVLNEGGSPAVSLMREIREATEGSKVTVDGELGTPVKFRVCRPAEETCRSRVNSNHSSTILDP